MGKIVQVKPGFVSVALPPTGLPFNQGQTQTLTDAEYSSLPTATTRALTVTNPSVTDPIRPAVNPSQSVKAQLAQIIGILGNYVLAVVQNADGSWPNASTVAPGSTQPIMWVSRVAASAAPATSNGFRDNIDIYLPLP